jgi:hypothetical protein
MADLLISPEVERTPASAGQLFSDVPESMLLAVACIDSGGDPRTDGAGSEKGLFHFTLARWGEWGESNDPHNPRAAARVAARFRDGLLNCLDGDLEASLACHIWGIGNVRKRARWIAPDWRDRLPTRVRFFRSGAQSCSRRNGAAAG